MDSKFFPLLLFVAVLSSSCSRSNHDKLIGEWKGTDIAGMTASLVLQSDGSEKIIYGNAVLGSKTDAKWKINDDSPPFQLDFVFTDTKGVIHTWPCIFLFLTEDKIQIRFSQDLTSRPTEFSDEDQTQEVVFTRQK